MCIGPSTVTPATDAATEHATEAHPWESSMPETEQWDVRVDGILKDLRADAELVKAEYRLWWADYLRTHEAHFRNLLTILGGVRTPARVLDIGSFPGQFTIILKSLGFEVSGVDLDPSRAGRLWEKHGIAVCSADVEIDALPVQRGSFDVVIFAEVLEHLRVNPLHALRECHRIAKSDGYLILSVPNISPRHRIRFLLGRDYQGDIVKEFATLEAIGHMGHFRLYSRNEVCRMLKHVGFEVESAQIAGWLPGGRWRFVRFLGPFRNAFRSHLYVTARKIAQPQASIE
jgi:2-polyprenyl-3-methyl-5-hydroxy-6-metoxy-1,4-benzoquinol methylase